MKIIFFPGFPKMLCLLNEFLNELQEGTGYVYQARRFDQDVEAGGRNTYVLIAYSAGAIGAVNFARKFPDRTEKIILINPAGLPKPRGMFFHQIGFLKEVIKLPKDERLALKKELGKNRKETRINLKKIVDFDLTKEMPEDLTSRIYIMKGLSDAMFPLGRVEKLRERICFLGGDHFYLTRNAEMYVNKIREIV
jgi:hypothetical protein